MYVWFAPQLNVDAPLGLIEPPEPAVAVIVSTSSFRIVPVETLGEPIVPLVAPVSVTLNVSSGSHLVSPFTSTVIVPLGLPPGITIDDINIALPGMGSTRVTVSGRVIRPPGQPAAGKTTVEMRAIAVPADPTVFVASIRALGEVVVFPTHDEQLNLIAQHLGELEVLAPFPGWDVLERVQSKRAQLDEAVAAGVDVPRTHYPSTAQEARAAAEDIGLPVLVKPEHPVGFKLRFRRQAFRCESLDEVEESYKRAEEFSPMVQELVPGGDDTLYTVGSYVARDGRPLGVFSGRKLRQVRA